jgi:hypothetical protein
MQDASVNHSIMRRSTMRRLITLAALATGLVAAHAMADMPEINYKPGLWNMSVSSGGDTQTMKMCIDKATQANMMKMGSAVSKEMCSSQTFKKSGAILTVDSVCKLGTSTITSNAVYTFTGDTGYTGKINSKYAPPMMGLSADTSTVTAKWAGACPAGMIPGDMIMANGMKMHFGKDGKPVMKGK